MGICRGIEGVTENHLQGERAAEIQGAAGRCRLCVCNQTCHSECSRNSFVHEREAQRAGAQKPRQFAVAESAAQQIEIAETAPVEVERQEVMSEGYIPDSTLEPCTSRYVD
jgi:hypothetical protein